MPTDILEFVIDARLARSGGDQVVRSLERVDSGFRKTTRSGKGTQTQLDKMNGSFRRLGRAAAVLGGTLSVAFITRATVRTIADFGERMSEVQAVSGATGEQFKNLTAIAKELGATTRFTASQAAEGMAFLSRAGFTAAETAAAIGPALNLAAAGALDLGRAADIASNIMSGFQIPAQEMGRVADVLAKTAASSNTNIEQLGEAMKFAAPIAANTGQSLEEVATVMGLLGNAGLQATLAGTGVRLVLAALLGPTDDAKAAIADLGLKMSDISPTTHGLTEIINTLAEAGLGAEEAVAIFGRRGVSTILALTSQVGEPLQKLQEEIRASGGAAAEMAEIMEDNLAGDIRKMKSAFEGLILAGGDKGLTRMFRGIVTAITEVLRFLSGTSAAFDLFEAGLLNTAASVLEAMVDIGDTVIEQGKKVAVFGVAWAGMMKILKVPGADKAIKSMSDLTVKLNGLEDGVKDTARTFRENADKAIDRAAEKMDQFAKSADQTEAELAELGRKAAEELKEQDRMTEEFKESKEALDKLTRSFEDNSDILTEIEKKERDATEAYQEAMKQALDAGVATDGLTEAYERLMKKLESDRIQKAAEDAAKSQEEAWDRIIDKIEEGMEALAKFEEQLQESVANDDFGGAFGIPTAPPPPPGARLQNAMAGLGTAGAMIGGAQGGSLNELAFQISNIGTFAQGSSQDIKELNDAGITMGTSIAGAASAAVGLADSFGILNQKQQELSQQLGALGSTIGGIVGGPAGAAIGGAIGQVLGVIIGAFEKSEKTFIQFEVRAGQIEADWVDRSNDLNDATQSFADAVMQGLTDIVDIFDGTIEGVGNLAIQIFQNPKGETHYKVWVDHVKREFATMEEAVQDAITRGIQTLRLSGLSPIAEAALNNFTGETIEELQSTIALALDVEALGIPEAGRRLNQEMRSLFDMLDRVIDEFQGVGAANVLGEVNRTLQGTRDAILGVEVDERELMRTRAEAFNAEIRSTRARLQATRAELLAEKARIEAIMAGSEAVVDGGRVWAESARAAAESFGLLSDTAMAFAQTNSAIAGVQIGSIDAINAALADLDEALENLPDLISPQEIRAAAGREDREAREAEIEDANQSMDDFRQRLQDIANPLDHYQEQLRDLQEEYEEQMARAAELGLDTDLLTQDYLAATAAIRELQEEELALTLAREVAREKAEQEAREERRVSLFDRARDFLVPLGELEQQFARNADVADTLKKDLEAAAQAGDITAETYERLSRRIEAQQRRLNEAAAEQFALGVIIDGLRFLGRTEEVAELQWSLKLAELAAAQAQLEIAYEMGFLSQELFDHASGVIAEVVATGGIVEEAGRDFNRSVSSAANTFQSTADKLAQALGLTEEVGGMTPEQWRNLLESMGPHAINLLLNNLRDRGLDTTPLLDDPRLLGTSEERKAAIIDFLIDNLEAVAEATDDVVTAMEDALRSLQDFRDSLDDVGGGQQTGQSRFKSAMNRFLELQNIIRTGTEEERLQAIQDLPSVAQELLDAAALVIPQGSAAFENIFNMVTSFIDSVLAAGGESPDTNPNAPVVNALETSAQSRDSLLAEIRDEMKKNREEVEGLRAELASVNLPG